MRSIKKEKSDALQELTPKEIGQSIVDLRKAKELTQEQLAKILGVSFQAVSKWENGMCFPELPFLVRLAEVFGTTIDDIISKGTSKEKKGFPSEVRLANAIFEEIDSSRLPSGIYHFDWKGLHVTPNEVDIDSESTFSVSSAMSIYLHISKDYENVCRNEPNETTACLFLAMSHPARWELLRSLMGENGRTKRKSKDQLRTDCKIEMQELTNHIDILTDAGIAKIARNGSIFLSFRGMLVASLIPALVALFFQLNEIW